MIKGHFGSTAGPHSAVCSACGEEPHGAPARKTAQHVGGFLLLIALAIFQLPFGSHAFAAAPHSYPKPCGTSGGPACPPPPPVISNWKYYPQSPFVPQPQNWFSSEFEVSNWFLSYYSNSFYCSQTVSWANVNPPARRIHTALRPLIA